MELPPLVDPTQQSKDREHLKLLSIFHFIVGGLAFVGIGFLVVHYLLMKTIFLNPEMWKAQKNAPPLPPQFFDLFIWIYVFAGALLVTAAVLNVLSGIFLRQRKHRMFSLIIAGLNCMQIPFGTALGVFTIIVLMRESVRRNYGEN